MWKSIQGYISALIVIISFAGFATASENDNIIILDNISVSFNGIFNHKSVNKDSKTCSENGTFWCQYEIGHVSDEVRQLKNFKLFQNDRLLFTLKQAPGSDLYISNSGIIAFMDHTHHYRQELTIHFYSKYNQHLFSETFKGASLFGFSSTGNKFGVGDASRLGIISILDGHIESYEKGFQFDISEDENTVVVALENEVKIYSGGNLHNVLTTNFNHTRRVRISSENKLLAVIDKTHLKVYSLKDNRLLFENTLPENMSYRDLMIINNEIITGIHYRDDDFSKGILKAYDQQGNVIFEKEKAKKSIKPIGEYRHPDEPPKDYEEIPWPFFPFDSMHTVWNYYEQHMSYGEADWSYLHQGLDIIVPIDEPTYAVAEGIVKCVLTLGGGSYWRTAISPEQSSGWSTGWLYAHLVESSIQFDVGDTVEIHDYLGDIIEWTWYWGHIHFVEIKDSGLVWDYFDNDWGITYNPLLSLTPDTDSIPPIIEDVFDNSKFAFCINETSTYLDPDSLYGDIDIIAKIKDYVGDSPWEQPAFETYYWITNPNEGDTVFPRTLGQILNHPYDFYNVEHYEPYATLLYKRDELLVPSYWMDLHRNYYHILTNNNGDSTADLSEMQLAFSTTDYNDGEYRIFIEALDEYGNSVIDSQDVQFRNGIVGVLYATDNTPLAFRLAQNYPNSFNATTTIQYNLPEPSHVTIDIYDILGRKVETLVNAKQEAGCHQIIWNAKDASSGVYFYKIQAGDYAETKKMVLLK